MSLSIEPTTGRLEDAVGSWARAVGVPPEWLSPPVELRRRFDSRTLRPSAEESQLSDWERRHGFKLPRGLRAWLAISDGFYPGLGPAVHPIAAIGPMVPFGTMPGLLIQPESWFEVGNPNEGETICIDLAYRWPGGDAPIFTSGDDLIGTPPRIIAPSFEAWFARLLREGGRPFWQDPSLSSLGDPWAEHRRRTPPPRLPGRLRCQVRRVLHLLRPDLDDLSLASALQISRLDAEALLRHVQHAPLD